MLKQLATIFMALQPEKIQWCLRKALPALFAGWFLAALLTQNPLVSVLVGCMVWVGTTGFLVWWPELQKKQRMEKVESELPLVLLGMSIELNLQCPFEKILEKAGQKESGLVGKEFQKVSQEIRLKGASVQEALRHLSERLSSLESKRAIIHLIHAYEQGTQQNKADNLKRIANELLAKQRIQVKAFGSKLALFSLVFIVVSAIVPALFQSFVLVGSAFLALDFSAIEVLLIIGVVFPLLDLAVLLFIQHKTPVFLR